MIYVLTYDNKHRKTQDLLLKLKLKGYDNISVLATPWEDRKNFKPLIPHRNLTPHDINLKDLCDRLQYTYTQILLSKIKLIANDIMLIGGAGIIPQTLVQSKQIINSHPAYLPYVRGLDSLKWAIFDNKPIGVTTHIISEEADAGWLIKRQLLPLYSWDTFHSVAHRQYEMEIDMLATSIEDMKTTKLQSLPAGYCNVHRRMSHRREMKLLTRFQNIIDKIDE